MSSDEVKTDFLWGKAILSAQCRFDSNDVIQCRRRKRPDRLTLSAKTILYPNDPKEIRKMGVITALSSAIECREPGIGGEDYGGEATGQLVDADLLIPGARTMGVKLVEPAEGLRGS
ncbi:hypothetical protein BaRGS_00021634 [Batillaria attramentaria]|uniref:Uncharacterized protein n=1 Tax=Batillaria attramentaria TaxID=370345 RepID=A0ABD0KIY7_9CAEN